MASRDAGRCRGSGALPAATGARADNPWLANGSVIVQQQALKDHAQAMAGFFAGTHHRPSWRKAGRDEGFRIVHVKVGDVRRLNRKTGEVRVPKAGWVRFRWSRAVPDGVKSYRVTRDRAGRWHVAFAVIPDPVPAPGNDEVAGIDRGVAVSAALSTGEMLIARGSVRRGAQAAAKDFSASSPGHGVARVGGTVSRRRSHDWRLVTPTAAKIGQRRSPRTSRAAST